MFGPKILDPINILQNIFFWALQKTESHAGLKQREGE